MPLLIIKTQCIKASKKLTAMRWSKQVLAKWTAEYGPVFKWKLAGVHILVITDPEEVVKLSGRELNLPKSRLFYKPLNAVSVAHPLKLLQRAHALCKGFEDLSLVSSLRPCASCQGNRCL